MLRDNAGAALTCSGELIHAQGDGSEICLRVASSCASATYAPHRAHPRLALAIARFSAAATLVGAPSDQAALRITLRVCQVRGLHHSCESISVGAASMQLFMIKKARRE